MSKLVRRPGWQKGKCNESKCPILSSWEFFFHLPEIFYCILTLFFFFSIVLHGFAVDRCICSSSFLKISHYVIWCWRLMQLVRQFPAVRDHPVMPVSLYIQDLKDHFKPRIFVMSAGMNSQDRFHCELECT